MQAATSAKKCINVKKRDSAQSAMSLEVWQLRYSLVFLCSVWLNTISLEVMLWVIHEQDTPGDPCPCPVPWTTLRSRMWQGGVLTARGGHSSILWLNLCQEEWTFCQPRGRGSSGDPSVCQDAWDRAPSTLRSVTCSVHRNVSLRICFMSTQVTQTHT